MHLFITRDQQEKQESKDSLDLMAQMVSPGFPVCEARRVKKVLR